MSSVLYSAEVAENDILAAAGKWIADNAMFQAELSNAVPEKAVQMANFEGKYMPLWRVDLKPTGYLIMAADDTLPPVVAFNTKGSFTMPEGTIITEPYYTDIPVGVMAKEVYDMYVAMIKGQ